LSTTPASPQRAAEALGGLADLGAAVAGLVEHPVLRGDARAHLVGDLLGVVGRFVSGAAF
jgi:hypothetical protein